MIAIIFLVAAFILSLLAAKNVGAPNWSLGWAALACYFLSLLLGSIGSHVTVR